MKACQEGEGEIPSFAFFSLGLAFTRLCTSEGHEGLKELS